MNEDFIAFMMCPMGDRPIDVIAFNGSMAVCVADGPIIITKEQAMAFFGLVEAL